MEIFLFFLPSSLLKCNSFLDSLPLFFSLSLPVSPFISVSVSPENLGYSRCISTQNPLGRCVCCGETPVQEDAGVRRGRLGGPRLVSRRDRCFPGYSGNASGVSSCFDSQTSVTSGCPVLCRHYYRTAFLSPNKLPFLSTHFPKPRMPQTWSTDLLKFRLTFPEENFPS